MNLSEKIQLCRKRAGLSQEALAEKLKIPMDDIRKYVPQDFTPQQISELAISLFKQYHNRQHNRDAR